MAKKDFEWTSEEVYGTVAQGDRKKHTVSFCSLEKENEEGTYEDWYVSIRTEQFFKKKGQEEAVWHITKNATFPLETWLAIKDLIDDNIVFEDEE